jgi:hypothetical protein
MVRHEVEVTLVEQVATTKVTQVFRNPTDRALEATYLFPVPKGASVNRFATWVDSKEVKGELIEADRAPLRLHRTAGASGWGYRPFGLFFSRAGPTVLPVRGRPPLTVPLTRLPNGDA